MRAIFGLAAEQLARAEAASPVALSCDATLKLATGLAILGRYDEAAGALERASARARSADERIRLAERRAWLLARHGDLAAAQATLAEALAQHQGDETPATAELRARLARLEVSAGRFMAALDVVAPALKAGVSELGASFPSWRSRRRCWRALTRGMRPARAPCLRRWRRDGKSGQERAVQATWRA